MSISYYPSAGEVLLCNFETGFIEPEMVKLRPVVIISPRLRGCGNLATVIPFSTTPPIIIEDYHYLLELENALPYPFDENPIWLKCDMIYRVSRDRLDRFNGKRLPNGKRQYLSGHVNATQLIDIKKAVLHSIGLGGIVTNF